MTAFTETQSYDLWIDIAAPAILLLLTIIAWRYISTIALKIGCLVFVCSMLLLIGFFASERLYTRIDDSGIHYRMFPIQFTERTIPWDRVSNLSIKDYIMYNGRGIYIGRSGGAYDVYTVADKYGLYIILNNGVKIILGTKKPDELNNALREIAGRKVY